MKFFFDILQLRLDFYFFRLLIFFIDTETLMLFVLSFYSGHLSYKNISLQCEQSGEVLCRRPFFQNFNDRFVTKLYSQAFNLPGNESSEPGTLIAATNLKAVKDLKPGVISKVGWTEVQIMTVTMH